MNNLQPPEDPAIVKIPPLGSNFQTASIRKPKLIPSQVGSFSNNSLFKYQPNNNLSTIQSVMTILIYYIKNYTKIIPMENKRKLL